MEAQTPLFEWQIQIIEQSPDFHFRIGNQVFIDDAMDAARKHSVEMRHQPRIIGIVLADIRQAVRKGLAGWKAALKAGPAAIKRMPPSVDNSRGRQNEMNESYISEILQSLSVKSCRVDFLRFLVAARYSCPIT